MSTYYATKAEGCLLLHQGAAALADVEAAGIRIDGRRLQANIDRVSRKISNIREQLKQSEVWQVWEKTYKHKANMRSRSQLGTVLFKQMGIPHPLSIGPNDTRTKGGRYRTDAHTLSLVDHPFVKRYLSCERLEKARATYLLGIQQETHNGYLHPSFNLHLVRSYRSSSDSPNFQNMPRHNPWIARLVRSCFIARPNHYLIESDFSKIEVCISACLNKDPELLRYMRDPTTDMHRDIAAELFQCEQSEVTKQARDCAKGNFVFAQFYGDWYKHCAALIWQNIGSQKLTLADGTPLKKHLATKGIRTLGSCQSGGRPASGTFERHVQRVEDWFWNERFRVYNERREQWWMDYQQRGYFDLITGFRISGLYNRNDVINYRIQGPAFHCLLWALIRLNRWLKKKRMKTKIVGQIHDSIVADVAKSEREAYLAKSNKIMTQELPKAWPWIIVPLKVEAEAAPLGGAWIDKETIS
ncbi:MAG: hypothetical protein JRG73_20085 [Deltaproteobacteria bacterium]|nr:hypothetical protein [Deltaproteobacteria bacterium]